MRPPYCRLSTFGPVNSAVEDVKGQGVREPWHLQSLSGRQDHCAGRRLALVADEA